MQTATIRLLQKEDNPLIAAIIRAVLTEFKANKPGTVYYDSTTDDLFKVFTNPLSEYWVLLLGWEDSGWFGCLSDRRPAGWVL